jgi:hypothetical protein
MKQTIQDRPGKHFVAGEHLVTGPAKIGLSEPEVLRIQVFRLRKLGDVPAIAGYQLVARSFFLRFFEVAAGGADRGQAKGGRGCDTSSAEAEGRVEPDDCGSPGGGGSSGDTIRNYRHDAFFGPGFCRRSTRPRFFSSRF